MEKPTEGWKWLINATKWHYFVDNKSLCDRWMTFSMNDIEKGMDKSPDNCKMCRRKLMARYEEKRN